LSQATLPEQSQWVACAQAFRQVYQIDKGYRFAGDAVYEEGLLYQQVGDIFGGNEHYRTAVNRLQFLVSNYPDNSHCPDALRRIRDMQTHLKNENGAADAARMLRERYPEEAALMGTPIAKIATAPPPPATAAKPFETAKTSPDAASKPVSAKPPSAGPVTVSDISHRVGADSVRVVIGLNGHADYTHDRLSGPDRVFIDIAKASLVERYKNKTIAVGDGHLRQIRTSQNASGTVRIVFDIASVGEYTVTSLSAPYRLEVELRYADAAVPASTRPRPGASGKKPAPAVVASVQVASAKGAPSKGTTSKDAAAKQSSVKSASVKGAAAQGTPAKTKGAPTKNASSKGAQSKDAPAKNAPAKANSAKNNSDRKAAEIGTAMLARTSGGTSTLTRMLGLKVHRIVLDPGHGGTELGAVGPGGLYEKDLTLAIARELKAKIESELDVEVIMTRNSDVTVPLTRRTAIANASRADLFISIHANSSTHAALSGVETYYFDFAKTAAEQEVAARENASSTYTVGELGDLVKKIAVNDKIAESKEFASVVQRTLFADARKLIPASRDRGVRSAPFVVLMGANMPSILAEVSFISNPKDEKVLGDKGSQKAIARSLYAGISNYVDALGGKMARKQAR
jgi:N-acetylmuramoyl-L-alanine amidase